MKKRLEVVFQNRIYEKFSLNDSTIYIDFQIQFSKTVDFSS